MTSQELLKLARSGPDGQAAEARLERFLALGGAVPDDDEGVSLLLALMASGNFLPGLLHLDPERWLRLVNDPWLRRPKPAGAFMAAADAAVAGAAGWADVLRQLRLVRQQEMLRLGARELGWGTTAEVAQELSHLAGACIDAATRASDAALRRELGRPDAEDGPSTFVVLGMGKLGGEELNFSSDVDLVYFYSSDAGEVVDGPGAGRSLHEYFVELSRRVTQAIDDVTGDGRVFRVDLRLRPEGNGGPICNSLSAAETYYESFGRTWERQAFLRARPCGGDTALGDELLAILDPFIYPRHTDQRMVEDIRNLRRQYRTKATGHVSSSGPSGFDVKLGAGGIRDVEMVAQTLQLLHGGKRRDLRERATPRALHRLWMAGLLSDTEHQQLLRAYRFWRTVEHRIQLEEAAQTQLLPTDAAGVETLALRLGMRSAEDFLALVDEHRANVERVAATFDDDKDQGFRPEVLRALDPAARPEQLRADLEALGFADVPAAITDIQSAGVRLPPEWLQQAVASPDPNRALLHFSDLAARGSEGLVPLLREHSQLRRALGHVFGTSDMLSHQLLRHTAMWESFSSSLGEPRHTRADMRTLLAARLDAARIAGEEEDGEGEGDGGALEDGLRAVRRFQAEEMLRIGTHDVAGSLEPHEVSAQLADVADLCLGAVLPLVKQPLIARYGRPQAALTVLGLGSYGAREMRYKSDLDLVFIYSSGGETAGGIEHQEWYGRLAQRLLNALSALLEEGRLYQVDTRLRPSGQQGMLVTSYDSFERYHREHAAGWERTALIRGRIVYSSDTDEAQARLRDHLDHIVFAPLQDEEPLREHLRKIRLRVERERRNLPAGAWHLRFDPGGIMDIEFLTALGQLRAGADDPALRTHNTRAALMRLVERGDWPRFLIEDYELLRRLALRLQLLRDRSDDVLPRQDVPALERTLELAPGSLPARLDEILPRIHDLYLKTFGSDDAR